MVGTVALSGKSKGLQGARESGFQKIQSVTKIGRSTKDGKCDTGRNEGRTFVLKPGEVSENRDSKS